MQFNKDSKYNQFQVDADLRSGITPQIFHYLLIIIANLGIFNQVFYEDGQLLYKSDTSEKILVNLGYFMLLFSSINIIYWFIKYYSVIRKINIVYYLRRHSKQFSSLQELKKNGYLSYLKLTLIDSMLAQPSIRFFIANFILSLLAELNHIIYFSYMLLTVVDINQTV